MKPPQTAQFCEDWLEVNITVSHDVPHHS